MAKKPSKPNGGEVPRDPTDPTLVPRRGPIPAKGASGAHARRARWSWSAKEWIAAFIESRSAAKASAMLGIDVTTPYSRRESDPEFAAAWDEADKKRTKRMACDLEDAIYDRCLNGWLEPIPPFTFNKKTGKTEPAGVKRVYDNKIGWQMLRTLIAGKYLDRVVGARMLDDLGVDPDAMVDPGEEFL